MWPGNTADVTTLVPVIDRVRRRFRHHAVCRVADRGMMSVQTMARAQGAAAVAHPADA
jgi:transposase